MEFQKYNIIQYTQILILLTFLSFLFQQYTRYRDSYSSFLCYFVGICLYLIEIGVLFLFIFLDFMGAHYQFRRFVRIYGKTGFYGKNILDIYLIRREHQHVGIKFRKPQFKHGEWRLHEFQCKIAQAEVHQSGIQLQSWTKHYLTLQIPYHLKLPSQEQTTLNSEQIAALEQHTKNLHGLVYHALGKSEIKSNKAILDWSFGLKQADEMEIFIVKKNKKKTVEKETGALEVYRVIHNPKVFYFRTESIEGQNCQQLINKFKLWQCENISYPKLMSQLMQPPQLLNTTAQSQHQKIKQQ